MVRKVIAYKEYFTDFYKAQEEKVQEKIEYVLDLVRFDRQVPKKFFKHLENTDMKNVTDFEDILIEKYGKKGTARRDKYDIDSLAFRLGAMLKEARKEANLTQEELAKRTGTKKSYISRIERGLSDIQVSTYYKLIEIGLGKHLNIEIA